MQAYTLFVSQASRRLPRTVARRPSAADQHGRGTRVAAGLSTIATRPWDVIVIGGGSAALVAALSAADVGAQVLLLERAPAAFRGGNTRHTRNVRCVHDGTDPHVSGSYLFDELWQDLSAIGDGPSDEKLANITVRESELLPRWMSTHGVHWQPALRGTLQLTRTNRFFLGGGKALVNTYFRTAEARSVTIAYETTVEDLLIDGERCTGVLVEQGRSRAELRAGAIVCASGGFEANIPWLREYWGPAAENYIVRGARYNDGLVLQALYRHGAGKAGQERGFHAIAVDARSPRYDSGIATRLDTIPLSVVVNSDAQRFYDEGEDLWPKRYATWGHTIALQRDQIAYSIWDAKVHHLFLPPLYPPLTADSLEDLARSLGLDAQALCSTIASYNASIREGGAFDTTGLDDCSTVALAPPKSHWALRIDRPPFYAVPLRPGITFTYLGVAVDESARVLHADHTPFANVFAAGEIMSGNILSSGYLAGFGLTIGGVWGRIAGEEAARAIA